MKPKASELRGVQHIHELYVCDRFDSTIQRAVDSDRVCMTVELRSVDVCRISNNS